MSAAVAIALTIGGFFVALYLFIVSKEPEDNHEENNEY